MYLTVNINNQTVGSNNIIFKPYGCDEIYG